MSTSDRIARARASYEAFAAADRAAMEALLADDLAFHSPPDPELDLEGWFARCWPAAGSGTAFAFRRLEEIGGDAVLVTYEATRPDGSRFRNSEVLTFAGDRIREIEVYFGWELPAAGAASSRA